MEIGTGTVNRHDPRRIRRDRALIRENLFCEEEVISEGRNLVTCIFKGMTFYIPSEILSSALLETKRYRDKKFVRYKEGAELYSMSERKFTELANNADAVMHIDKIALVNTEVLDKYIELYNR